MRCHSVCSFFSPSFDVQFSVVAMLKLATDCPPGVTRTSASLPRLPTRITLFTLPIARPLFYTYSNDVRWVGVCSESCHAGVTGEVLALWLAPVQSIELLLGHPRHVMVGKRLH